MKLTEKYTARVIGWLAGILIAGTAFGVPIGYYYISYQHLLGHLETEAEISATIISQIINANPDYWEFEQVRLAEYLSRRPANGQPEIRRILNTKNAVVAESADTLAPPLVTRSNALRDSGVAVGRIEISVSLKPLLGEAGALLFITLPLGLGVFIVLDILPLHIIRRAEETLRKTNEELKTEISARKRSEEDVRRLNEELERKVEERTKQLLEAQEVLIKKEKLAIIGRLAEGMGNELRNPLGVMNNAVYFLKTVLPEAREDVSEYLDIIKHEIANSQRIISGLLDYCSPNAPRTKPISVVELIQSSLKKCAIPENVMLRTEIPEKLPRVTVDLFQMSQVFWHLITNAAQAMPEGGVLTIRARSTRDGGGTQSSIVQANEVSDPPLSVDISVADTGSGITPENIRRLFQPLFTTKSRGMGLGLPTSRNFTEANNGRIEVESRPGKGTTFTVILPAEGNEGGNRESSVKTISPTEAFGDDA